MSIDRNLDTSTVAPRHTLDIASTYLDNVDNLDRQGSGKAVEVRVLTRFIFSAPAGHKILYKFQQ